MTHHDSDLEKLMTPKPGIGKRTSRRNVTIGIEVRRPNGSSVLIPVVQVPRNTSKHMPHQGEREKARRRKQQEKQAA